ncbi:MAG: hypothetical protein ACRCX4_10705 [Bacteroidales bacterium]
MSCNLTFEQWGVIISLLFSVISIVIAVRSSKQTSKDAQKQIQALRKLQDFQIDVDQHLAEEQLYNVQIEYKRIQQQAAIGEQDRGNNVFDIRAMNEAKKSYNDSFNPQLRGCQRRISELERIINDLKAKRNNE